MAISELRTLDGLPEHRHLLARAVDYFSADLRVLGLLLGGSVAAGGADFYSDVDLDVVLRDEDFDAVFGERDIAAEALGRPLFRYIADHLPFGAHMYMVLYEGLVKVDLSYYRASEVRPSWTLAHRVVLQDTDGRLAEVISRSRALAPGEPAQERILSLNEKFWTWCWYVFGKIVRGEWWEALDGVHAIRSMAVLPMMDWLARRPGAGYRRLESQMDPGMAGRLATTVASLQPESLYAALQQEMSLFSDLRDKAFARYGLSYELRPEQQIRGAMDQLWQARAKGGGPGGERGEAGR